MLLSYTCLCHTVTSTIQDIGSLVVIKSSEEVTNFVDTISNGNKGRSEILLGETWYYYECGNSLNFTGSSEHISVKDSALAAR